MGYRSDCILTDKLTVLRDQVPRWDAEVSALLAATTTAEATSVVDLPTVLRAGELVMVLEREARGLDDLAIGLRDPALVPAVTDLRERLHFLIEDATYAWHTMQGLTV